MSNVNQITCKHGACYDRDYKLEGVTLGSPFPSKMVEKAKEFTFSPEDILVASYPRSGEALFYEAIWLLMNEADTESATNIPLSERLPLLELCGLEGEDAEPALERLHVKETPRVMCTHLPFSLLGPTLQKGRPRVVLIIRDPKELVLSLYLSYRRWPGRELPSFTYFFETFVKTGRLLFGGHVDHLLGYWEQAKDLNILVMKYDEMLDDAEDTVLKISHFLEKDLTPKQIHSIVRFVSAKVTSRTQRIPLLDAILGVRLFERESSDLELTDKDEDDEEEKGRKESTEIEITQQVRKPDDDDDEPRELTTKELFASANYPLMEVELVCVQEALKLSPEQNAFFTEQCKAHLEPAGLTF